MSVTLACRGLSKVWESERGLSIEALRGIDLDVSTGEFVAILGPSGSGKSTLLELIAGLEPVSAGAILLNGAPVHGPNPDLVMVFQEHSLFPWLTVAENVGFGLKMKGVAASARAERVAKILATVRLARFARHYPHQLSGGMKQRVALARALIANPQVILMDEPFAALDFQTRSLMQKFLLEVWLEFRSTIVFVTHHIDEAVMLADRVVVMTAAPGRVIDAVGIDLPRPRDALSDDFNRYRARLTAHLEREVMRAQRADEAADAA
jgi:NitT/TauT family transport system ATP-binding protein